MVKLNERPFYLSKPQEDWVRQSLEKLSVRQKIGQLFCVMGGDYPLGVLAEMIETQGVGSVLYRPAPAAEIRAEYAVLDQKAPVPLLKAANLEEGGAGAILDGTLFGWPMTVGATNNPDMVEKFARVCAAEGRSIGVNWTFSPVSDLSWNYLNPITNVRAYSDEFEKVRDFTAIFARTVQSMGVAACAKHFPGDGVDFRDQHLHPTYNSLDADTWDRTYGAVYQNLIENDLLSIMVGHIIQPAVAMRENPSLQFEDLLPASQSREMMTGVLRERFGFNGVITTDATIMAGYTETMARREALPATIMAGADMIVFNTDFQEDYRCMEQALEDGRLTMERLEEAVTRVLALKAKLYVTPEGRLEPAGLPFENALPKAEAEKWQKECADQAITLVKDKHHFLPFTAERYPKIRLITLGEDAISDGSMKEIAMTYLKEAGFEVEDYDPFADDLHGTEALPKNRVNLWLTNYPHASNQTTVRVSWCPKHALDSPRFIQEEKNVFLSFGNPYLLMDVPRMPVYINAYTATRPLIEAALSKVIGRSAFKGVSPVDAFCHLPDTRL